MKVFYATFSRFNQSYRFKFVLSIVISTYKNVAKLLLLDNAGIRKLGNIVCRIRFRQWRESAMYTQGVKWLSNDALNYAKSVRVKHTLTIKPFRWLQTINITRRIKHYREPTEGKWVTMEIRSHNIHNLKCSEQQFGVDSLFTKLIRPWYFRESSHLSTPNWLEPVK